jgi:hypothetical protein
MRLATLQQDGWELESGEARHAEAPTSFAIPPRQIRQSLLPGMMAKLLFVIVASDEAEQAQQNTERMWVSITEQNASGYLGRLVNKPFTIREGVEHDLRWGVELALLPEHVIDIEPDVEKCRAIADDLAKQPKLRTPRSL